MTPTDVVLFGGPADGMQMSLVDGHPPYIRVAVPRHAPVPPGMEPPPTTGAMRGDYTAALYRPDPTTENRFIYDPHG